MRVNVVPNLDEDEPVAHTHVVAANSHIVRLINQIWIFICIPWYNLNLTPASSLDWPLRMNSLILPEIMEKALHTSWIAETVDKKTNQNQSKM